MVQGRGSGDVDGVVVTGSHQKAGDKADGIC